MENYPSKNNSKHGSPEENDSKEGASSTTENDKEKGQSNEEENELTDESLILRHVRNIIIDCLAWLSLSQMLEELFETCARDAKRIADLNNETAMELDYGNAVDNNNNTDNNNLHINTNMITPQAINNNHLGMDITDVTLAGELVSLMIELAKLKAFACKQYDFAEQLVDQEKRRSKAHKKNESEITDSDNDSDTKSESNNESAVSTIDSNIYDDDFSGAESSESSSNIDLSESAQSARVGEVANEDQSDSEYSQSATPSNTSSDESVSPTPRKSLKTKTKTNGKSKKKKEKQ